MTSLRTPFRHASLACIFCLLCALPASGAEAETPAEVHLGGTGQGFLSGSTSGLLQVLVGPGDGRGVNFNLSGAAGYFVTDWVFLRLGLGVGTSYQHPGPYESQTTTFTVEPGVGVRVPLGAGSHAFLPSLSYVFALAQNRAGTTLSLSSLSTSSSVTSGTSHSLNLRLAFSIALVPHLNLLVGPAFGQAFTTAGAANAQSSRFNAALEAGLLGYF